MKKNILLLVFSLLSSILYAQLFTINPSNPVPRVGDKMSVSYTVDQETKFDKAKSSVIKLGETFQTSNRNILRGNLELNQKFEDTGDVKIGPIIIGINGKQYKSDSITLKVLPALPDVDDGFWIQCVEVQKTFYIVTEQIISVISESSDSVSRNRINPVQEICASLKSKSVKIEGIKDIVLTSTRTVNSSTRPKINNTKPHGICTKIYKVILEDSYKNNGELTKANFDKLPENLNIQPVKIKFN
jgi:hypothetical protein